MQVVRGFESHRLRQRNVAICARVTDLLGQPAVTDDRRPGRPCALGGVAGGPDRDPDRLAEHPPHRVPATPEIVHPHLVIAAVAPRQVIRGSNRHLIPHNPAIVMTHTGHAPRRAGLTVLVVAPTHHEPTGVQRASVALTRRDRLIAARRSLGLSETVVAPTLDGAVGVQPATEQLANRHRLKDLRGRVALLKIIIVVPPTSHRAAATERSPAGSHSESFSLHLALMSVAQLVREQVEAAPTRSFIYTGEVAGSRRAVECELSRLASSGEVIRVWRGLYWKGPRTRLGMPLPRPDEIALAVAGPGAGPARLSAAAHLGLTTQVPAVDTIAVAGRTPTAPAATRFVSRSVERRIRGLTPTEVAVIEVLREGPDLLEVPWEAFAAAVTQLAASRELRHERITEQLGDERHVAARDRWRPLAETLEP